MRMLSDTQQLISFIIWGISLLAHRIYFAVITIQKIFRPILKERCINVLVHSMFTISRITSCSEGTLPIRVALFTIPSISSSTILNFDVIWMSFLSDGGRCCHSHIRCLFTLINHLSQPSNLLHWSQDCKASWLSRIFICNF